MLVLTRKLDEVIVIDGQIRIKVVGIRGNHVRLGIEAPDTVGIFREELIGRAGPGQDSSGADSLPEPSEPAVAWSV